VQKWNAVQQRMQAQQQQQQVVPQPVRTLPPEGWYPDADREHLLRWWNGRVWTDQTAPRL
jgi:hypothetical protein